MSPDGIPRNGNGIRCTNRPALAFTKEIWGILRHSMTTGSTGNRSLVLLFGPGSMPLAETAAFYAGLLGVPSPEAIPYTLRLGLAHNQTLAAPSLLVSRGDKKRQIPKMSGKQAIARLLWALSHPSSKETSLKTASETDEWLSLARQGTLSPILKKLSESETLKKGSYLLGPSLALPDLILYDLFEKTKAPKTDLPGPVKSWLDRIAASEPLKKAQEEITKALAFKSPLDAVKFEIASYVQASLGVERAPDLEFLYSLIEEPRDRSKGDLALPVVRLRLNDVNLPELIKGMSEKFTPSELVTGAVPAGPFINFFINRDALRVTILDQVQSLGSSFGTNSYGAGKFGLVEFSSPNIAKPFHAGHLRSTIIGNFVCNVLKANGWETLSMNYLGDWGKQYGLLAVGFEKYGSDAELLKDPIRHLYDVYVKINADATDNPEIHDEARAYFKRMEDGDKTALALWQRFRDLSIGKYKEIYGRLNVAFDVYSGESQYSLTQMRSVLDELTILELLKPDQGALMVDLAAQKLGVAIIGKTDGSMLYLSRDIAANIERKKMYDFDEMFYVVGSQQEHHFKQLFTILKLMGKEWADKCHHINFGMIKSKDGNMSTRKGSVVFLEDILNQVQEEMHEVMKKNEVKYAQIENPVAVSDIVGMSSIMIQDMSARRHKNYEFDWNRMLSFEGDTGPYLQYAHARLCSIERAALESYGTLPPPNYALLTDPKAQALIDVFLTYPDIVRDLASSLEPCNLVTYILRLSHAVSTALDQLYVMGREPDVASARLAMYSSARIILGNALRLLGLKPLERM